MALTQASTRRYAGLTSLLPLRPVHTRALGRSAVLGWARPRRRARGAAPTSSIRTSEPAPAASPRKRARRRARPAGCAPHREQRCRLVPAQAKGTTWVSQQAARQPLLSHRLGVANGNGASGSCDAISLERQMTGMSDASDEAGGSGFCHGLCLRSRPRLRRAVNTTTRSPTSTRREPGDAPLLWVSTRISVKGRHVALRPAAGVRLILPAGHGTRPQLGARAGVSGGRSIAGENACACPGRRGRRLSWLHPALLCKHGYLVHRHARELSSTRSCHEPGLGNSIRLGRDKWCIKYNMFALEAANDRPTRYRG